MTTTKKRTLYFNITIAFSVWLFAHPVLADAVITLEPGLDGYGPDGAIEMLHDPDRNWSIDDVSTAPLSDRFERLPGQPGSINDPRGAVWFRFTVDNSAVRGDHRHWVLDTRTRVMDSFKLFTRLDDGWRVIGRGYREIGEVTFPIVAPLHFSDAGGAQTFYVRVENESGIYLTFCVLTAQASKEEGKRLLFWFGVFYGLMGLFVLINLVMFLYLRDKSYLLCFAYQTMLVIYTLGQNGFFDTYFPTPLFLTWVYFHVVMISLIVFFSGAFTRSFLNTKAQFPGLDKLLLGYMAGGVAGLVLLPFCSPGFLMWFTMVLGLGTPLATILPGIQGLRRGFRAARFHLAAWGIFSICIFLFALPVDMGWLEVYFFQGGCAANAILLTLALGDRMGILRREREAAGAALQESERKFRTLANSTNAHIAISKKGRIVYANKAFIDYSQRSWVELENTPLKDVLAPEAFHAAELAWSEASERGDDQFRYELCEPSGRCFEVAGMRIEVDGDEAVISTAFDVTKRKQTEQQMFRAEKMASLGQIIAGVAHEINNPNNFIYFNLPILKKYIDAIQPMLEHHLAEDPKLTVLNMPFELFREDLFKLLENMAHGSERITGIVSELKNYVRLDEAPSYSPQQINGVIDHVMTLIGKQVRKMVKRFDVETADDLPPVKMSAGKIEQVLINLVINAGQAADKEDSWLRLITRRCKDEPSQVEIIVEDNGCGIAEENLNQIFEPFYTSKGKESGTGLGLSISQKIIEEHNGTIGVTSTPGEGTRFTIRLPVAAE